MGRHRAPSKSTPTATDLIAQIEEEDSRPPEPITAEIEVVWGDDAPTERIDTVPLRVTVVDTHAEAEAASISSLEALGASASPVLKMRFLPPVFPVAVEVPQGLQDVPEMAPRHSGAHRAPEALEVVTLTARGLVSSERPLRPLA